MSPNPDALQIKIGSGVVLNIGLIGPRKGQVWLSNSDGAKIGIDPAKGGTPIGLGPVRGTFSTDGTQTLKIEAGALSGSITFSTNPATQGQVQSVDLRIGNLAASANIKLYTVWQKNGGLVMIGDGTIQTLGKVWVGKPLFFNGTTTLNFADAVGFTTASVFPKTFNKLRDVIASVTGDYNEVDTTGNQTPEIYSDNGQITFFTPSKNGRACLRSGMEISASNTYQSRTPENRP